MWKFKDKTHKTVTRTNSDGSVESALADRHQPYLDWLAAGNSTLAEDGVPLATLRAGKIAQINSQAQSLILAKYPLWVQANCANGVYSTVIVTQMKADIVSVITAANTAQNAINAATDEAGVDAVTVTWPVI